jgi:hypothetical protein
MLELNGVAPKAISGRLFFVQLVCAILDNPVAFSKLQIAL